MKHFVISRSRHDKKMDMQTSHFHDRYEVYYLLSGERFYFIDNQMHLVQAGDLVFIDRYALHQTRDTGIAHHERILIEFSEQYLGTLHEEMAPIFPILFKKGGLILRLHSEQRQQVASMLMGMLHESQEDRLLRDLKLRLVLSEFLIWAARHAPERAQERDVFHPTLRSIISWISANFRDTNVKLEQLSKQFSISKYYLCRLFKQGTGYTFTQYVNLLRVREAQRLLRETDLKIMTISEQSGFDNVHHFCRVFKQLSHQSPIQYRKEHTKQFPLYASPEAAVTSEKSLMK